ncbi:hypothetical protein ACHAXT_001315 [Thalassiosira profunda]
MSTEAAPAATDGGTLVQLPPAPPSDLTPTASNANPREATNESGAQDTVSANIARRTAGRDARKRELLVEARKSRVAWILDEDQSGRGSGKIPEASGNLLGELRACQPDILPCAPELTAALLSSNCAWHPSKGGGSSQNVEVRRILEERGLSWEAVAKQPSSAKEGEAAGEEGREGSAASSDVAQNAGLDLPPIPSPEKYASFLNTLCEPSAADVVMSTQKFCKTIREAASVMVASMAEGDGEDDKASGDSGVAGGGVGTGGKDADVAAAGSESSRQTEVRAHGASLAKAVKGFVNSTVRQLEEHDSFRGYLRTESGEGVGTGTAATGDKESAVDGATKEQLQASVERFVFGKCRGDIDRVLSLGDGLPQGENSTAKDGLREKMHSLQFVTPAHLEIECLKSSHAEDVDLSYTVNQLQSLERQASPRQMLHSILLAHRGVTASLKAVCETDYPPGADDVLPTLILATLRAHPAHLSTILGVIEHFAPLALLRGEAGYAYTNLCGAVQFIKELDVEGHLAEVALGVTGEGAVLSIGPEEFRAGLEECRRKMKAEEEKLADRGSEDAEAPAAVEPTNDECWEKTPEVSITARQVREARSQGETVDLDWAIKRQNESMWQQGKVGSRSQPPETEAASADAEQERPRHIPPEDPPLPSQFSRSYSFLTTNPSNIGVRDLPRLLEEYKMLVHATERLLNERTTWRENERKRQLKLEREHLERDFAEAVGPEAMEFANGH